MTDLARGDRSEYPLSVASSYPGTNLTVYDWRLRVVADGRDEVEAELPAGLYKLIGRNGGGQLSELFEIGPGMPTRRFLDLVDSVTLLPIWGDPTSKSSTGDGSQSRPSRVRSAELRLLVRSQTHDSKAGLANVVSSMALLDPSRTRIRHFGRAWQFDSARAHGWLNLSLSPGCYTLAVTRDGRVFEQAIYLADGWSTYVAAPTFGAGIQCSLAAVLMQPLGRSWTRIPAEELRRSESTFSALRRGEAAFSQRELKAITPDPKVDPILGILAAYQLVAERQWKRAQPVVRRLIGRLPDHPDVRLLGIATGQSRAPLDFPPMFRYAQDHRFQNSDGDVAVRGSYAEHAMSAAASSGIWLNWTDVRRLDDRLSLEPQGPLLRSRLRASLARLTDRPARLKLSAWQVAWRIGRRSPFLRRGAVRIAGKLAGWDSAPLQLVGVAKISSYSAALAGLKHATASMSVSRSHPEQIAAVTGVPLRLARAVQRAVTDALGDSMVDPLGTTPVRALVRKKSADSGEKSGLSPMASWAAVGLLVAFVGLVVWMLATARASEDVWQRQMYIFASVEAVVFAAAGALFGVEVKRREVGKAAEQAELANEAADEARRSERIAASMAQRGATLAATARGLAAANTASNAAGPDTPSGRGAGTSQQLAIHTLARVADELFPPDGRS